MPAGIGDNLKNSPCRVLTGAVVAVAGNCWLDSQANSPFGLGSISSPSGSISIQ